MALVCLVMAGELWTTGVKFQLADASGSYWIIQITNSDNRKMHLVNHMQFVRGFLGNVLFFQKYIAKRKKHKTAMVFLEKACKSMYILYIIKIKCNVYYYYFFIGLRSYCLG